MMYKVIVIGGGASGIITAIESAKRFGGEKVCLLEAGVRIGKKLLATGNGRCNLSNADMSLSHYHGDVNLAESALGAFNSDKLKEYFNGLGVMLTEEDGKIYPMSLQANSVLDMLLYKLQNCGVVVKTDSKVTGVKKTGNLFKTTCQNGKVYESENLVFATGGSSGKSFGTDGKSFSLIESLGHTVTELSPSLVKLKCDTKRFNALRGIKVKAKVTLLTGDKQEGSVTGDLLFTDGSISGNTVFSLSSLITDVKRTSLRIDFLPTVSEKELTDFLAEKKKTCPYLPPDELFTGIVNKQLGKIIYKLADGDLTKCVSLVKNMRISINDTVGFNDSQVTKGGVPADEINEKTFESRLVNKLFLAGELLNVDGDCGGYNLHFAFASGYVIGNGIK